jgi:enolase
MTVVRRFIGEEVLDSRGNPTVAATCELASGAVGRASVPSGASKGSAEAAELRDGDMSRYAGLGCRMAAANVNGAISDATAGTHLDQRDLDELLVKLDGTSDKRRLGANALLAASLAFARAGAQEARVPLHSYLAGIVGEAPSHLPRPIVNLFSGGKHAGGQVEIQDVMVVTVSTSSVDDSLAMTSDVYRAAAELVKRKYGERPLVADEGGFAPAFNDVRSMLEDAVESIEKAGVRPGSDMALCIDLAASHFYEAEHYQIGGRSIDAGALIEMVMHWLEDYPIVSLEDALAEEDWAHWPQLLKRVGRHALVVGDDLLVTHPERIRRALESDAANALLLKVNQIGTLSEALEANQLARRAGWMVTFSARSGETEDDWLADLAVGWHGDQLKVGSMARSERLAKWNRLLAIERETRLPVAAWPAGG